MYDALLQKKLMVLAMDRTHIAAEALDFRQQFIESPSEGVLSAEILPAPPWTVTAIAKVRIVETEGLFRFVPRYPPIDLFITYSSVSPQQELPEEIAYRIMPASIRLLQGEELMPQPFPNQVEERLALNHIFKSALCLSRQIEVTSTGAVGQLDIKLQEVEARYSSV